jgi:hypothetical protein
MSSTSPLPQARSFLGNTAQPIPVPDRGTHIPASYAANMHSDPEGTIVRDGALPLLSVDGRTFTVSQVAEERRWAINEDGTVIDQMTFQPKLEDVRLEFYSMLRSQGRDAKFEGDIGLEPVPAVARYVALRVDPLDDTKLIEIGFDPNKTAGAVPTQLADSAGENAVPRIEALIDAYHSPRLRKSLRPAEVLEVEDHLGLSSDAGPEVIASELESVTADFTAGKLTDMEYAEKVRGLTGAPKTEPVPPLVVKAKPPVDMIPARCGASCKGKRGKRMHEMNCKKCNKTDNSEGG